jgi:cyclase
MLKKRLIGVIVIKDSWAVQSFGYGRYLPLGRPEHLAENLDRWGADEILVLSVDRSSRGLGPDFRALRRLSAMGLSTPLTYGGGIHTAEQAVAVIQAGAERICIDAALRGRHETIRDMASLIGAQALIAALPLSTDGDRMFSYDYRSKQSAPLDKNHCSLFAEGVISEALIIDWRHEGQRNSFDMDLIRLFPCVGVPLIIFGGLSEPAQLAAALGNPRVVAAGVGNFLSYSEHAIQRLKKELMNASLRPPVYVGSK